MTSLWSAPIQIMLKIWNSIAFLSNGFHEPPILFSECLKLTNYTFNLSFNGFVAQFKRTLYDPDHTPKTHRNKKASAFLLQKSFQNQSTNQNHTVNHITGTPQELAPERHREPRRPRKQDGEDGDSNPVEPSLLCFGYGAVWPAGKQRGREFEGCEDEVYKEKKHGGSTNRWGFEEAGQVGSPWCSVIDDDDVEVLSFGVEEIFVPFLPSVPVLDESLYGGFKLGFNNINTSGGWWYWRWLVCGRFWCLDPRWPICLEIVHSN